MKYTKKEIEEALQDMKARGIVDCDEQGFWFITPEYNAHRCRNCELLQVEYGAHLNCVREMFPVRCRHRSSDADYHRCK